MIISSYFGLLHIFCFSPRIHHLSRKSHLNFSQTADFNVKETTETNTNKRDTPNDTPEDSWFNLTLCVFTLVFVFVNIQQDCNSVDSLKVSLVILTPLILKTFISNNGVEAR